jgi:hypothetical protein
METLPPHPVGKRCLASILARFFEVRAEGIDRKAAEDAERAMEEDHKDVNAKKVYIWRNHSWNPKHRKPHRF